MKKTISLILCFAMLLSTVAFSLPAFAVELDFGVEETAELAQEPPQDEAVLMGTEGNGDGKPGYNIITGTKDPYDFDDPNYDHAVLFDRNDGVWEDPSDKNNRVMKISQSQYSNVGVTPIPTTVADRHTAGYKYALLEGKTFEGTRPFTVTYDIKGTKTNKYVSLMSGIGNYVGVNKWKEIAAGKTGSTAMTWKKESARITYADAIHSTGTFVLCFLNNEGSGRGDIYIDNISIVPDYRVVFYESDGTTVIDSEYVSGSATSYTIPANVYSGFVNDPKFLGFKLVGTDDEDIVEGTVNLANEDLSFVAVRAVDVKAPSFIEAVEGKEVVLTAKYDANWSVDDETLASIEGDGDSATITTKGYAGTINVTATSVENPERFETVAIRLRGPSKAKPGVNIFTGTTAGLGFEESAEEIAKSVSFPREDEGQFLVKIAENPNKTGNTSGYVLELFHDGKTTAERYPQVTVQNLNKYGVIEKERPIDVSFDVHGTVRSIWFFDDASGAVAATFSNNINKNAAKTGWTSMKYILDGAHEKNYFLMQSNIKKGDGPLYIDNFCIVPYYKVTYLDETGAEAWAEYVSPSNSTYTVNAGMISGLDSEKFDGYKVLGTDTTVTSVALANEDIILVPSSKEGVEDLEFVTLTFVNDGIRNAPAKRFTAAGTTIKMADYYGSTASSVAGKRFVGWSTTENGDAGDVIHSTFAVTGDTTFYPVLGYDFNFATADGQSGWSFNAGNLVFEEGFMKAQRTAGSTDDQFVYTENEQIPACEIYKVVFWAAQDYVRYSDKSHSNSTAMQFEIGERVEGLYHVLTPQKYYDVRRSIPAYVRQIVEGPDGKMYAGIEVDFGVNPTVNQKETLKKIRFDTGIMDVDYRYIQIVGYEEYTETEVNVEMAAPVAGELPSEDISVSEIAKISNVNWTEELSEFGRFKAGTVYKATFDISPAESGMKFAEGTVVDVDVPGASVEIVDKNEFTSVISVEVTFGATVEHKAFDFNIDDVPTEIIVENPDYIAQFEANITETTEGVPQDIVWKIIAGDAAKITADGLFTVEYDGVVTVQAKSVYNDNKVYTKEITISLVEGLTTSTVSFEGELENVPAAITKIAGSTIDMSEYLNLAPAVSGKILNGWIVKGGDGEVIVSDFVVPEEDVVLCAIVNYNIDMIVPANASGWRYNAGTVTHNAEKNTLVASYNYGTSTTGDVILSKSGFAIPAKDVYAIAIDLDPKYTVDGKEYLSFEIGKSVEGIFYKRTTDSGMAADRQLGGQITEITDDGYARAFFPTVENMYEASGKNWNGTIDGIRFDIAAGFYSYGIRRILFLERSVYEENQVEFTGIVEPETAKIVDFTSGSDELGLAEIVSIDWMCDDGFMEYVCDGTEYVRFDGGKEYTVAITAKPADISKKFTEDTTATINGKEPDSVVVADEGKLLKISYTFTATQPLKDFELAIDGPAIISKADRTTQYNTAINGNIPVITAAWSIEESKQQEYEAVFGEGSYADYEFNPDCAIVFADNGKITPVFDGIFTLVATSHYNPEVKARLVVQIKNQDSKVTLTFDKNTDGEVTGMPEDLYIKQDEYYTVKEIPEREGYTFLGWSKTADGAEYDRTFYADDALNLYAVWAKTVEIEADGKSAKIEGAPAEDFVVVTTKPGAIVTVMVETTEGAVDPIVVDADENGVAKIELPDANGIELITVKSNSPIIEVVLSDNTIADAIIDAVAKENEATGDESDDESSGSTDTQYNYDTTVEDVKPTTDAYKTDSSFGGAGESDIVDTGKGLKDLMASEDEILINFDKDFEKEFFPASSLRQFNSKGMNDSVVIFENKGNPANSNDSSALFTTSFALDAETHPYVVIKIKNTADSTLRAYFRTAEIGFADARSITNEIKSDYTMVVYDMSSLPDWNGTITGMFFSTEATAGHLLEIDWIMFTDEVPENMDVIEGTRELFPTVNKDVMAFDDVKIGDWFYEEVAAAYRMGFVEGVGENKYSPLGHVTIAQVITLAVRLNYSYYGLELPEIAEGAEWYSNYVKAAQKAGIIKTAQFDDYNKTALRKEVAQIIQKALPAEYLPAINVFKTVPDVSLNDSAYGAIKKLYNAGIVIGMDDEFNFYPNNSITRAEIAAIVNRMAIPTNRKRVVTEEELEQRRSYYYVEDIVADAETGNCYNKKLTISNKLATAMGKTNDPIVYLTNVVGELNGAELSKITVGLKTEALAKPVIFFTTPGGSWDATRLISGKAGEKDENGVTAYTFDTKANSQFANTITGLRFDPFDAKDIEFSIAYVIIE